MDRIIITKPWVGICHMQVCVVQDATDEEILRVCNADNPSGTTSGWTRIIHKGEGAPVQCADDSGRLHVLAEC